MKPTRLLRILIGLLFVLAGALLFLRLSGIEVPFNIPAYFFSWQMILIIFGLFLLFSGGNRNTGLTLLIIGAAFLARDIFGIGLGQMIRYAIPLLLVIAGLLLLFPRIRSKKKRRWEKRWNSRNVDTSSELQAVHIFSGGSRLIRSDSFRGGEIVCIFGGSDLHFRECKLSPGDNILNVSCVFGGVDLYIPNDWTIRSDMTTILAGVSDKRIKTSVSSPGDPEKVLVIKGFLMFAGLEIKTA